MTKVTLNDVADLRNPTTSKATINNNYSTIEAAFDNTLSRNGASPNTMSASLDMNSNRILNLPAPVSDLEPLRLIDTSLPTAILTDYDIDGFPSAVQWTADGNTEWGASIISHGAGPANLAYATTYGTSATDHVALGNGDAIWSDVYYASDGTDFTPAAKIKASVDGTVSTGIVPGSITIATTDSAGDMQDRMVLDSGGGVLIAPTPPAAVGLKTHLLSPRGAWAPGYISANSVEAFNYILVEDSQIAATGNGPYALYIGNFTTGGSGPSGGGLFVETFQLSGSSNPVAGWVGGTFLVQGRANEGGILGAEIGSLYGISPYAKLESPGTFFANVTGGEVAVEVQTGASCKYVSSLQLVQGQGHAVSGSSYDCLLGLSNQSTFGAVNGILFGNMNGQHPVKTTGKLIATTGARTADSGIDFSSYTFTTNAFKSTGFTVNGSGDISGVSVLTSTTTVGSLPAAAAGNKGMRMMVSNANATTFWSIVAAGGANIVPVTSDGTNWRIG